MADKPWKTRGEIESGEDPVEEKTGGDLAEILAHHNPRGRGRYDDPDERDPDDLPGMRELDSIGRVRYLRNELVRLLRLPIVKIVAILAVLVTAGVIAYPIVTRLVDPPLSVKTLPANTAQLKDFAERTMGAPAQDDYEVEETPDALLLTYQPVRNAKMFGKKRRARRGCFVVISVDRRESTRSNLVLSAAEGDQAGKPC